MKNNKPSQPTNLQIRDVVKVRKRVQGPGHRSGYERLARPYHRILSRTRHRYDRL